MTVDFGQRRVWRGDTDIELPRLSFDLLAALVRAAPNCLSSDELLERVWSGTIVSPATISKRAELLREALGDDSHHPRYVGLVRGHGYRLLPAVEELPQEDRRHASRRWVAGALAAGAVVALVAAWVSLRPDVTPPGKSIAVLPFVALSDGEGDENFADGLTEQLSHELARSRDLRVTGRTSSFYYKGRSEDLRIIGETLGVANLLEGSVRRYGDRLRVSAQLVATADGFHLWSETYDRRMDDVLDIQQDIARSVATRLRATLGMAEAHRSQHSPNPEAYALYLRAVSLSPYRLPEHLGEAQSLAEQAVELDPGFAPAWNRLAAIHGRRLFYRDPDYPHTPQDGVRIALDAVNKALALDPESGEAYANLGGIAWVIEGNAAKAAPLIEKALARDPWNLDIVAFAAEFAKFFGRIDDALLLEERLVERDPLCTGCRTRLADSYLFTKRFEDAEHELRTVRMVEGEGLLWHLGVVYLQLGKADDALASFEQMAEEDNPDFLRIQGRAMALHALDRKAESAALLAELVERWASAEPVAIGQALAYVGRRDEAFAILENGLPHGSIDLQIRYPSPLFDGLRNEPRWDELLRRIGRAPEQVASIPFKLQTVLDP